MKKCKVIMFCSILFLMASCAANVPLIKETKSGFPEGTFRNTTIEEVKNKLIKKCASKGLVIDEASKNKLICSEELPPDKAAVAGMLFFGASSTTPITYIAFILYQSGDDANVVVHQWLEAQTKFGQNKKVSLTGNNNKNMAQKFLFNLGAE